MLTAVLVPPARASVCPCHRSIVQLTVTVHDLGRFLLQCIRINHHNVRRRQLLPCSRRPHRIHPSLQQPDPLVEVPVHSANVARHHAVRVMRLQYYCDCCCRCCSFASQLFCLFWPPVCLSRPEILCQARFFSSVCPVVVRGNTQYPVAHSL